MKAHSRNGIILTWLLAAIFVMPMAVRSVHLCHQAHISAICAAESGVPGGDTDSSDGCGNDDATCPLCHFVLSCFTAAASGGDQPVFVTTTDALSALCQGEVHNNIPLTCYRRGPPAA